MNTLEYIIETALAKIITEAPAQETDNAPSDGADSPFTPAEEKFLGKFDARGTTHIGIIYSPSDIGIREFISRSGTELNLTPGILLNLLRKKIIKIVPYTGYGRNTDYTLELQLSLDDVSGLGDEEKKDIESGTASSPAGRAAAEELPAPAPEVAWVIPYGTLIKESTVIAKQILSEKSTTKKQAKSKIYVNKSRVLKRLPKSYITELERIIDMMGKRTHTAHEKQRIIADILDNLAVNFELSDKQIKKSYEFYKNQKRLQESIESADTPDFIYESIVSEDTKVSPQRTYLDNQGLSQYILNAATFWDQIAGVFTGYGFDWDEQLFFTTFRRYLWGANVSDKRKQAIVIDAMGIILKTANTKRVPDASYTKLLTDWIEDWYNMDFPIQATSGPGGAFSSISNILNYHDVHKSILSDDTKLTSSLVNGLNSNRIGKLSLTGADVNTIISKTKWFPTYTNTDTYKMVGTLLAPYRAKIEKDAAGHDVLKTSPADKLSDDQKRIMARSVIAKINDPSRITNLPTDKSVKFDITKSTHYGGAWVDKNAKPYVLFNASASNTLKQYRLYSDGKFTLIDKKSGKVEKTGKYWFTYNNDDKQFMLNTQTQ